MDIFKYIKHNFGQPVLQLARKLEKTATQSASWKNHLTFNHQCKRLGITSPSLRLHTNVQGQRKLTTVRIAQCHERLRRLHITHQHLTASLASSLPPQDFTNLTAQIQRLPKVTFQCTKDRQKTKLVNLLTPNPPLPPSDPPIPTTTNLKDRWLFNKSSITLTKPQVNILTKGLAFRPTPRHPPTIDFITATEYAAIVIGPDTAAADNLRTTVAHILTHPKTTSSNITPEEAQAITDLRKIPNIKQRLSTIKGSQCPWRIHLFMFLNFHFIQLSIC
jgi:hypothetical protein